MTVNPQDVVLGVYDDQKSPCGKIKATPVYRTRIENSTNTSSTSPLNIIKKETKCNENLIQLSLKENPLSSAQENSVLPTFVVTSRVKSTKPNLDLLFSLFDMVESDENEENEENEFSEFCTSPGRDYDSYTESSDSFGDNDESLDSEFSTNWLSLDEMSSHRSSLLSNFVECLN